MKRLGFLAACALLLVGCDNDRASDAAGEKTAAEKRPPGAASGRAVWTTGSSTVAPFSTRVAQAHARETGEAAPRVESVGTAAGLEQFCAGVGANTPDIANASRRMTAAEFDRCSQNGVGDIAELRIGYDGVVIATARNGPDYDLTLTDVYRGLAAQVPGTGGRYVANPHRTWSEVRAGLPAQPIRVHGPPATSGTRAAFVEMALEAGAESLPGVMALRQSDPARYREVTGRIRTDGAWIEEGENDDAIVQAIERTPGALGVFGWSFVRRNGERVKAAAVSGAAPTDQTILSGAYPLSRSLYLYVKKAHLGQTQGLEQYVRAYVSAAGPGGDLAGAGLIPLPAEALEQSTRAAAELPSMTRPAARS